jgi:hypothetical protein
MVSLSICQTARDRQAFEDVAETLHGHDAAFIPPFPGSIAKFLSPKSVFNQRHGEIIAFVARRDGKLIGRIAAVINRSHNEFYKDKTGFFGFFECENDVHTARALFEKAAEILRGRGFTSMRGPYNPSINDECGVLLHGFEKPPYIGLTWNPSYYDQLIKDAGVERVRKLLGYNLPLSTLEVPDRIKAIADRQAKRSSLRLRPMDLKELPKELEIIQEVYNSTLERNWGFFPISMDDLLHAANDLKAIADPRMILIAECKGERAGVAMTLPNINELLILTKKTPKWLRPLHVLWLMKTRRIKTCRQIVYGVSPRFRDRGLHGWFMYEQLSKAKTYYDDAELGWIEENNFEMLKASSIVQGYPYRSWGLYSRDL